MSKASPAETRPIVGLHLEIEDETTGAVASYHVLSSYTVNLQYGNTQAVFATYVSKAAYERKRQPVSYGSSINIAALPPEGVDVCDWLYRHAAAPADEGNPTPSPLAGAEPVYAD